MSICRIEFTRRANAQIRSLFAYIAQDNPDAALAMVDRIEARVMRLAKAPDLGVELPQDEYPFLAPGYRRLLVKPYLVYYRETKQVVYITHIVHERQNQKHELDF